MNSGVIALVIADTHLTAPDRMLEFLSRWPDPFDVVIHAGDFCSLAIVEIWQSRFPFFGVWGNNDPPEIRGLLPERCLVNLGGFRLGVTHGHGEGKKDTLTRAYEQFQAAKPDAIVFGHSHQPVICTKQGILMLNPGSLFAKRRERRPSCLVLDLNYPSIRAELVFAPG
ncbi:MAG TPA: metallophosphoesterase family protein [Selenomonadales bacterium]|nr:metallophosphoesterase family protein [Selenomonadales bacterium]